AGAVLIASAAPRVARARYASTPRLSARIVVPGVLWVLAFSVLLESVTVLISRRPFDVQSCATAALIGIVVLTVVAAVVKAAWVPERFGAAVKRWLTAPPAQPTD